MLDQRVNIQYSIDIEELPREVKRLLEKAQEMNSQLEGANFKLLTDISPGSVLSMQTLESVDVLRKKIASVDYILNDVSSIINGFLEFKLKASQPVDEPQTSMQPPSPSPTPPYIEEPPVVDTQLYENFNNIQQQLKKFKENSKKHQ